MEKGTLYKEQDVCPNCYVIYFLHLITTLVFVFVTQALPLRQHINKTNSEVTL